MRLSYISLWFESLYGQVERLFLGDGHIISSTRVQQGDPLGPLLFAHVLCPIIHQVKDNFNLLLNPWYLGDETIIRDSHNVAKSIDIIRETGPGLGLEFNIRKNEIIWPSCGGSKLHENLFP